MKIKEGDIVGRISYNCDVYFKVIEIYKNSSGEELARLKGMDLRLCATAAVDDLVKIESSKIREYWHNMMNRNHEQMKHIFARRRVDRQRSRGRADVDKIESFDVPGKVLHIDGDKEYLDLCLTTYKQLGVPAHGYNVDEDKQAGKVIELLKKHNPDILVITGHDGFVKGKKDFRNIKNYHNSSHFVESVKAARRYEKNMDDLIIFAGACQSHYEAILEAGANFASSPQRVLIHAFDPVFIVEKIAFTSIYEPIPLKELIAGTITGFDGVGGLETRGKHRLGTPKSPY
ncbi:sporulation peptidase YabG [Desulfolucanica intricata]|uniref:sporulation peptidase YabG n=1 Tax=Desulfolucanica intricata TaxID=1285191 RepID=UPI000B187BC9|nr:sporulation peptidase YabG [Desulfolucanica intricata]